jgi:hypothetical protein
MFYAPIITMTTAPTTAKSPLPAPGFFITMPLKKKSTTREPKTRPGFQKKLLAGRLKPEFKNRCDPFPGGLNLVLCPLDKYAIKQFFNLDGVVKSINWTFYGFINL